MKPKKGAMPPQFAKGKKLPVSKSQARRVAMMMGAKKAKAPAPPMDAEDMIDGGADESKEKS